MKGTLRPGRKAGVLALAVLLLSCVLMAGAVSASDEEIEFQGDTCTIDRAGTYVLNKAATGNITIDVDDGGDVTLKAINGATLNGGIQIKDAKNVTIDGMHINSTLISKDARNLAIEIDLPSDSFIKLCLMNNTIDFAASDAEGGSSVISTQKPLSDGSAIINNTIFNVTAHVLNTAGVVDDGTLTVQGNRVTMSPDEEIGPGDTQGKGRALLKLFHGSGPNSKVNYIVADNDVSILQGKPHATVVRVDETTSNPGRIAVTMYNNTYNEDPASPYLYGGSIDAHDLGELNIIVSETDGTRILVPGLNQTGVVWSGDATNGYTLVLDEQNAKYKLMDDVTINSMTVSAENVVIDGNKDTCTLTLSGTAGYQGVITVDHDATLKNLNVVAAAEGAAFGTAIKVMDGSLTDSTIDLRNQNAQPSSAPGRMSAIAVYVVSGEISGNEIWAGNSETSSSQCVVVSGSGVTVSGNTLTTGESAKGTSGSVGIRLSSGASGTTNIIDNRITSTRGAGLNNGIAADGVKNDVTIEASGNTFDLATEYGGAFYVNPTSSVNTVTINANGNTVESAASFIYADNVEEGVTTYTISAKIENNDFAAATEGLASAEGFIPTLGDLQQSGNSGLITDPSESLDVDTVASEITVAGATVDENGGNATITFTGYTILITNVTVSGSVITYKEDSTATVTHNPVHHMGSSTNIVVELLITDMSKLGEISTPKATIGDGEKKQLAAQKITPVSVVDIHYEGEPGFDQITLTVSDLISSGEIIGFHVDESGVDTSEVTTQGGNHVVKFTDLTSASPFGIGVISDGPQPVYSSGGNMDNAYRVLFNDGSTTLSVQTDLSSGDKLTKPETPVKDGYTFAGWYKDSACTQAWDFETGISGDMTLYAKWTAAGSSGETDATATPTATSTAVTTPQPTKTQTAAATTSAPEATTAAGVSPTLTQAPAPVAGALFGLLAAGVLLRRRFQ